MKTILTIGSQDFLFEKLADASKVIDLLGKSLAVESETRTNTKPYFFYIPDPTGAPDISLKTIAENQLDLSSLRMKKASGPVKRTGPALLPAPVEQPPLFTPNPMAPLQ